MNDLEQMKKRKNRVSAMIAMLVVLNLLLLLVFATNVDNNNNDDANIAVVNNQTTLNPIEGNPNIADIATGANFTVALDSNGKVWSWGQNNRGQLGNGTIVDSVSKVAVLLEDIDSTTGEHKQLTGVKQIAVGEYHSAALTEDGKVYVWGYNYFGQTGSESIRKDLYAQQVTIPNGLTAQEIACGADFTLLLTTNGTVLGLGDSSDGQLGYYNDLAFTSIREIEELKDTKELPDIKEISAGYNHVIAIGEDDTVWTWGDATGSGFEFTSINEVTLPSTVAQVQAGNGVSMALCSDGTVYTWNLGSTPVQVTLPTDSEGTSIQVRTDNTKDNISIVNKTYYIIDTNNNLYSWGQNSVGQTGTGNTATVSTPTILVTNPNSTINNEIDKVATAVVPGISSTGSISSNGGYDTAYAINADGYVLGWGYAGTDIVDASYTVGSNNGKLLGDGTRYTADYIGSVSVKSIVGNDIKIRVGESADLIQMLKDKGYITGGRVNLYRQEKASIQDSIQIKSVNEDIASYDQTTGNITGLMIGRTVAEIKSTKNTIYINVEVIDDDLVFPKIETRNNYSVALKADGTVWVWGYNRYLGIIDYEHSNVNSSIIVPTKVQGLEDIKDIAAGEDFILVLKKDGTVWSWGYNGYGQLGNGTTSSTPVKSVMASEPEIVQVKTYNMKTVTTSEKIEVTDIPQEKADATGAIVLVDSNGTVYNKTGDDFEDLLGNLVIKKDVDGKYYKWNYSNNDFETQQITQSVLDAQILNNVESISAGRISAMALDSNGKVWGWGYNDYNRLGLSSGSSSNETLAKETDLSTLVDAQGNKEIVKQIEVGTLTSYIVTESGSVYACGYNGNYQCGISGSSYVTKLTKINSLNKITKISASIYSNGYAVATSVDGKLWALGERIGYPRIIKIDENIIDAKATDNDYGVIVKFADGTVGYSSYIYGSNVKMTKFTTTGSTDNLDNVALINGTKGSYIVAKTDGTVWSAGVNNYGQLGNRTITDTTASKLEDISKAYITLGEYELTLKQGENTQINAIYNYGFNLLYDEVTQQMIYTSLNEDIAEISGNTITANNIGKTYIVGEAPTGEKLRITVNVLSSNEVANPKVSAGYYHTLALKSDGTVWGWGQNYYGELGTTKGLISEPIDLGLTNKYIDVSAGEYYSLLLGTDGKVQAIGYNGYGQLGNNTRTTSSVPVTVKKQVVDSTGTVTFEDLDGIIKVLASEYRSLALAEDGTIYTWGYGSNPYATVINTYGLKVKDITSKLILTEDGRVWEYEYGNRIKFVTGLENIVKISSSAYSSSTSYGYFMALTGEGKVYTWVKSSSSYNYVTGVEKTTPTLQAVDSNIKVVDIKAGAEVAYIKDEEGNVYSWGKLTNALGQGTNAKATTAPVKIASLSNIESIVASSHNRRAYAITTSGSVYGFGYNGNYSLLGNGEKTSYYYEPKLIGESYAGFIADGKDVSRVYLNKGESLDIQASLLDAFNLRLRTAATTVTTNFEWTVFNKDLVSITNTTGTDNKLTANDVVGEAIIVATDKISGKVAKLYVDVKVTGTEVAPKIESSEDHTVALKADGTVWVWGKNSYGELGILQKGNIKEPKQARIAKQIVTVAPDEKLDASGNKVTDADGNQIYVDSNGNEYYKLGNNYTDLSGKLSIKLDSDGNLYKWNSQENEYELEDLIDENGNSIVVTDIATSKTHTLMLTTNGDVYICGSTYYNSSLLPIKVDGLKDVVKIASGDSYSLALDKYGRLWTWGYSSHFHLSTDSYCHEPIRSSTPTKVSKFDYVNIEELMKNAIDITNGYVLTKDGEVVALRLYDTSLVTGTKIAGISEKVIKITKTTGTNNSGHTAFLTENGLVYTIGKGTTGQLGNETWTNSSVATGNAYTAVQTINKENDPLDNIRDIYVGLTHTVAVNKDGKVLTWGSNNYGELRSSQVQAGVNLARAYDVAEDARIEKAILVSAGENYTVVVDETGFAYAWGKGTIGQLGNKLGINSIEARRVGTEGISLDTNHVTLKENGTSLKINAYNKQLNLIYNPTININSASMTNDSNIASVRKVIGKSDVIEVSPVSAGTTSAVVSSTGNNGENYESIIQITVLPSVAEMDKDVILPINKIITPMTVSGNSHTLILKSDGTVWAYGDNTYGQTGLKDAEGNNITYSDRASKVEFPAGTPAIIGVSAGDNFSIAVDINGDVYTWGYNKYGQLGQGSTGTGINNVPTKVSGLRNIIKVVAGANHSIALDKDGYIYTWGRNISGSLGIGSTSDVYTPTQINDIANVIDIAAGADHSMALTQEGCVYTTGKNDAGQLGEQYILSRISFAKVEISNTIEYIEAGNKTSFAIDTNGNLWAWGQNADGQLGLGSNDTKVYLPQQVTIGSGEKIESISAGENHTQVVTSSGKLYVAGSNNYGQLGVGTGTDKTNTYVNVSKLKNEVMRANAGITYSTVIAKDGTVYGFGDYNHGNLNRISLTNSFEPIMITDNQSYLDEQEIVINVGEDYTINANGRYKLNVLHKDESAFTYTSANDSIASVDDKGLITGKEVGTTVIKVEDEVGKISAIIVKVLPEDAIQSPSIEGGNKFAIVTDKNGIAYLFGNKENIIDSDIPKTINNSISFKTVKAGDDFVVAINNDGTVWSLGDNTYSQLGIEGIDNSNQYVRLNTTYIKNITQVDAGSRHAIALDELGTVYVWGDNSNGQLGLSTSTSKVEIPTVIRPTTNRVISVSAGGNYSSIVNTAGEVYILRNGAAHKVVGINGAIKAVTGEEDTLVLTNNGNVYIVDNETGLIRKDISDKVVVDIATNLNTYMCLTEDKTLYTFGDNADGKLGVNINASTSNNLRKAANDVFTIGGGNTNTYYINTKGEVFAAGLNTSGELGNGTSNNSEATTKERSLKYTKVGDREFVIKQVKADGTEKAIKSTRVGIDWTVLVGEEDIKSQVGEDKTRVTVAKEENEFNAFGKIVGHLEDYAFKLTDITKADLTVINDKAEITTKELGETILEVTNTVTNELQKLKIIIVEDKLLRIDDIYILDANNSIYDSEPDSSSDFVINTEGSTNTGTLNISLEYDTDIVEAFDENGNKLTIAKDATTKEWIVSGLDLTKPEQKVKLTITTSTGDTFDYTIIIRKEFVLKVDSEILTLQSDGNYIKFINPANQTATIEATILDSTKQIKIKDMSGSVIASSNVGDKTLTTVVNVPEHKTEFVIETIDSDGQVERKKLTIFKSSIESIFVRDITNVPTEIETTRTEIDGAYLDEFYVEISGTNKIAVVTVNLKNKNVQSMKADGLEVTVSPVVRFTTPNEEIELELTVLDSATNTTYIEKYKLTAHRISNETGIDSIQLLKVNGTVVTLKDTMFKKSLDEDYTYEIALHDKDIDVKNANFTVNLIDIKNAQVSANTRQWHDSGYEFVGVPKTITENKYQYTIYVKAENGDIQEYKVNIYKESEDAKVDTITTRSPLDDGTYKENIAVKTIGTNDYIGKVLKGKSNYEIVIKLRDEYTTIESIEPSDILTLKEAKDGIYTYNATADVIGKTIDFVTKPEYDGAPKETYTLTILELDDDANFASIQLGNLLPFTLENVENQQIDVQINGDDSDLLDVKAQSEFAKIEIFQDIDPRVDTSAIPFATSVSELKLKLGLAQGQTTTLYIRITSEDETNTQMKILTIKRLSNNTDITHVVFDETNKVEYIPGKDVEISESLITKPTNIKVVPADNNATVVVEGVDNAIGASVDLSVQDTINVEVTSEDGTKTTNHTIKVKVLSSDTGITKQIKDANGMILKDDVDFIKDSTDKFTVKVKNTGKANLVITPNNTNAKVEITTSTSSVPVIGDTLEIDTLATTEVYVKVTSEDGTEKIYTIIVKPEDLILQVVHVNGASSSNTALDTGRDLTADEINNSYAVVRVHPNSTKATIKLTANSVYAPVTVQVTANRGMTDSNGKDLETTTSTTVSTSGTTVNIDLLDETMLDPDIDPNKTTVIIDMTTSVGTTETLVLDIVKGSVEAELDTVKITGITTNKEEIVSYKNKYAQYVSIDSSDDIYEIIPVPANNGTYKLYQISDTDKNTALSSIDLTKQTDITNNSKVTLEHEYQRFVIEVTSEFGGNTERYDLYAKKISDNTDIKDLSVTVDDTVTNNLDDFGKFDSSNNLDIIVPSTIGKLHVDNLVLEDNYSNAKWTNITNKDLSSITDADYSDYTSSSVIDYTVSLPSDISGKRIYIKVTAENGKEEVYCVNIKIVDVNQKADDIDLINTELYDVTNSTNIEVNNNIAKITESVIDAKVTSISNGVIGIKVSKVNGFDINERIATSDEVKGSNALDMNFNQNYTYTDDSSVTQTIVATDVQEVKVLTTVVSLGYKLYPTYYTGVSETNYKAEYELTIERRIVNKDITIEIQNADTTVTTIDSKTAVFKVSTENGQTIYTYEYRVPSTTTELVINNVKAYNLYATIEHALITGNDLYTSSNPYIRKLPTVDKASITEDFKVIDPTGNSVIYRVVVVKDSGNNDVEEIKVNSNIAKRDDSIQDKFNSVLLTPVNNLNVNISGIEENATVDINITSINNTNVSVLSGTVNETKLADGTKLVSKDITSQLTDALLQANINREDLTNIIVKITVTAEDNTLAIREYTLSINVEKSNLISIDGLDINGTIDSNVKLTSSDFYAVSSNTFETKEIAIPSNTGNIVLSNILCENDSVAVVTDENGNVLTNRTLTVSVLPQGVTKVIINTQVEQIQQQFVINIRRRSIDTSIKEVIADINKTDSADSNGIYVVNIKDTVDPDVTVVLNDKNAEVIDVTPVLSSVTASVPSNNKFTVSGIKSNTHNDSEDVIPAPAEKTIDMNITVEAEDGNTDSYTIRLERRHTEIGLEEVDYIGDANEKISFAVTDIISRTISSSTSGITITSANTVCANAEVFVEYIDDQTGLTVREKLDTSKLYEVGEGSTKAFKLIVVAEYGNEKEYTLNIRRKSSNTNLTGIQVNVNGRTENAILDSIQNLYTANINVNEDPQIIVSTEDLNGQVTDVKVYKTTEGDLEGIATSSAVVNNGFSISGLKGLYVDDTTEDSSDINRYIMVEFKVAAEDANVVKTYKLKLTRRHVETGVETISYDYVENGTTENGTVTVNPTNLKEMVMVRSVVESVNFAQILPECKNASIKVKVDGTEIDETSGFSIDLPELEAGDGCIKTLEVIVTSESEDIMTYTIQVVRMATNANLNKVYVKGVEATKEESTEDGIEAIFKANVNDTDVKVAIEAISANVFATVSITDVNYTTIDNGKTYEETGTYDLSSITSRNVEISIVVTPQDDTIPTKTYKLVLTRLYDSTVLEQIKITPVVDGVTDAPIEIHDNESHSLDFTRNSKSHGYYTRTTTGAWVYNPGVTHYWNETSVITIPTTWTQIKLSDVLPVSPALETKIEQIEQADCFGCTTQKIADYTLDDTFIMPEGEDVYFKVITTAESGNEDIYLIHLYKKATSTELVNITVDGKTTMLDTTDGSYKVNVRADKDTLPIVINGTNKLSKDKTTIKVTVNGNDVTTLLGTSKTGTQNQVQFTLSSILTALDYDTEKEIVAVISVVPEDETISAKDYTVKITRQHVSDEITNIVINKGKTVEIDGNTVSIEQDLKANFVYNSIEGKYVQQINVTSQLDTATISEINLECANATKVITINGIEQTLPFDISLPNEGDSVTIKVEVTPEYEESGITERYIVVRRMYSNDSISKVQVEREYPETRVDKDGNEYKTGRLLYDRVQDLTLENNNNYSANIRMDQNTTRLTIYAQNSEARIVDIEVESITDKDGNSVDTTNKLKGLSYVYITYYNSYRVLENTRIATIDTSEGRVFTIKVKVQSEDLQVPVEEYTITLTKQDDSAKIEKILGNGTDIAIDNQKTHYEFVGKDILTEEIYTQYVDSTTAEVITEVFAESKFAKVTIFDENGKECANGIGTATYPVQTLDLWTKIKVKIESEDGLSAKEYEVWFIKKSDDVSIKELYVDDELIPADPNDGNYYIELSDTVKQIKAKMIPNYKLANVSINGQPYKWQEVTEVVTDLDKAVLVNGKVRIELRVQIPAEQSESGVNTINTKYLFVDRVSTNNEIEKISTDNAQDNITPGNNPQSTSWGTNNTYFVLLEGTGVARNEIDLSITPKSPKAKVELFDLDGNKLSMSTEGTLVTYSLGVDEELVTTYKVRVTPQQGSAKEYYIEIVPKASQAELKILTIGGINIELEPGVYQYKASSLGLTGIGSAYALATANTVIPGDDAYGSATVNIYTIENPEGSGEQTTGEATLNNVDLDNTTYVTITVESPNKAVVNTYVVWLKDVSDDRTLQEVSYIDENGIKQLAKENVPTDAKYAGEYEIALEPEQNSVDISIIARDMLSTVEVESDKAKQMLEITKDVKSMNDDIVLDIIVKAESGNKSVYKLKIKKNTIITGKIITENYNKDYSGIEVNIADSTAPDTVIATAITETDGTYKVEVSAGTSYNMTINKSGYLPYTMINIPSTYGVRTYTGHTYLIAGEVSGNDNYIDLKDLVKVNRKARVSTIVDSTNSECDFNEDGIIDNLDLNILIKNYDKSATDIAYVRVVEVLGEVLDATKGDTVISNAKVELREIVTTNANGEFEFENVPLDKYVLTITDENGIVLGSEEITIKTGTDYAITNNIITIDPNMSLINLTVRVNGSRAVISKRGEASDQDISVPTIKQVSGEVTSSGIELQAEVEDAELESVTFYNAENDAVIYTQSVTGTSAKVSTTYNGITEFNKTHKLYVVVKDTSGNVARKEFEVIDNLIRNAQDLVTFSELVNNEKDYANEIVKLNADIDLSGITFNSIGKSSKQFKGTFDGCGYTINNININTTSNYAGLFGYTKGATIKNVGVSGTIISTANYVGGIVGWVDTTIIENCYSAIDITANSNVGGIVGCARGKTIIRNCYNKGNITGNVTVAGIIGRLNTTDAIVENCYNIGTISGTNFVGEIIGYRAAEVDSKTQVVSVAEVNNCYYLGANSGIANTQQVTSTIQSELDKLVDTTSEITDKAILLINLGSEYKEDIDNINNGYPVLAWQKAPIVTYSISKAIANSENDFLLPLNESYTITSEFGTRIDPITGEETKMHYGIDLASKEGAQVLAIANGTVTYAGENSGYGYCIEIKHEVNGEVIYSFYAHLKQINVQVGDNVTQGQIIALEGGKAGEAGSGTSTGVHLHLEIRKISGLYSSAVDPRKYLTF